MLLCTYINPNPLYSHSVMEAPENTQKTSQYCPV